MVCEGNAVSPVDAQRTVACKYARAGQIVARTANGIRQTYEYDKKGQLLAVKDADGNAVERYVYDKAGNMLKKTVGGKTTTFTFDAANQLVSSTTDGVTTRYTYDAAGRLVKEGNKTYTYGYLDKVMSVSDGKQKLTYDYHADGQIASANYGNGKIEEFLWDGLALIHRGGEHFINEPHVGGGNPVVSSKDKSYFNDMLGTTVGFKTNGKYSPAALSAFGEDLTVHSPTPTQNSNFFTGKPFVEGLGHAFLMRNYRAGLAKWQTADPMGYPDGWNQLAYCRNWVTSAVDFLGAFSIICRDQNNAMNLVYAESSLRLVEGSGSAFSDCFVYEGEVMININLSLMVDSGMRRNQDFLIGDITEYKEHTGANNDSSFNYPVYEAVCAHERGHAQCFFTDFIPYFRRMLEANKVDDYVESRNKLMEVIASCYLSAVTYYKPKSNVNANRNTLMWFLNHSEWKFQGFYNGYRRWIKE